MVGQKVVFSLEYVPQGDQRACNVLVLKNATLWKQTGYKPSKPSKLSNPFNLTTKQKILWPWKNWKRY